MPTTLLQADLPGLDLIHRGKVRDVFALSGNRLLIVATDRLSAFDVVLPDPIPGKGEMLTPDLELLVRQDRAHHAEPPATGIDVAEVLPAGADAALYAKRAVVTKRLKPVPVEAIARGYLIGSGWKDYQAHRPRRAASSCPPACARPSNCPQPIFTPSTKAAVGDHDENIELRHGGRDHRRATRRAACATRRCAIYKCAADYAAERGIIIADTKFEFGTDADGTPLRDGRDADAGFLALLAGRRVPASASARRATTSSSCATTWRRWTGTRRRPARACPPQVIAGTADKYAEALWKLAGIRLD